jgi:hypothetical protein
MIDTIKVKVMKAEQIMLKESIQCDQNAIWENANTTARQAQTDAV